MAKLLERSQTTPLPEGYDPYAVTKELAAQALPVAVRELISRLQLQSISTTQLQSGIDQLGKLSGYYAKQEGVGSGGGFSIKIVLGGGSKDEKTITIGAQNDLFGDIPTFMVPGNGNLSHLDEIFA